MAKIIYPNKITETIDRLQAVYLVACQGPSSVQNAQWARVWECSRWMPFNWANTSEYDLNPGGVTGSLYMYGPIWSRIPRLEEMLVSTAGSSGP